jgi:hypothetical protein
MVRQLDDTRFVRHVAAVATTQGAPSVARLMMREAFKRPPKQAEASARGTVPVE